MDQSKSYIDERSDAGFVTMGQLDQLVVSADTYGVCPAYLALSKRWLEVCPDEVLPFIAG